MLVLSLDPCEAEFELGNMLHFPAQPQTTWPLFLNFSVDESCGHLSVSKVEEDCMLLTLTLLHLDPFDSLSAFQPCHDFLNNHVLKFVIPDNPNDN